MTSTTPERTADGAGERTARVAELFGQHGAADVPFVPFVVAGSGPVAVSDYHPLPFRALAEAWRYRKVGLTAFRSVLWIRLTQARLGPTWIIVQSFANTVGFAIIFGGAVFSVRTPNGMPYILYSMVGMLGWQLFQQTMFMSMRGFRSAKVVQDIPLPLVWVPVIGSAAGLVRSLVGMMFYAGFVLYFWITKGTLYLQLSPRLLGISAAGLGLCLLAAWGVGMWLAPLYAWAIDVRYVLRLAMPFWMFMTPVLYPIDQLGPHMRLLVQLNPLTAPIEMTKVGLLGTGSVHPLALLISIPLLLTIFFSGIWFITRYGYRLAALRTGVDLDDDGQDDGMML
jgi:homopolymeric O-antigen transport system permease protein